MVRNRAPTRRTKPFHAPRSPGQGSSPTHSPSQQSVSTLAPQPSWTGLAHAVPLAARLAAIASPHNRQLSLVSCGATSLPVRLRACSDRRCECRLGPGCLDGRSRPRRDSRTSATKAVLSDQARSGGDALLVAGVAANAHPAVRSLRRPRLHGVCVGCSRGTARGSPALSSNAIHPYPCPDASSARDARVPRGLVGVAELPRAERSRRLARRREDAAGRPRAVRHRDRDRGHSPGHGQ